MKYFKNGKMYTQAAVDSLNGWAEISAEEYQAAHDKAHDDEANLEKILKEKAAE